MAAKKSKAKTAPSKVNKSEFIRQHSKLPPAEIVALAKKQGIELSINMVYTITSQLRTQKAKPTPSKATKTKPSSVGAGAPSKARLQGSPALEAALIDSVLEIGAGPTRAILEGVVAHLKANAHRK